MRCRPRSGIVALVALFLTAGLCFLWFPDAEPQAIDASPRAPARVPAARPPSDLSGDSATAARPLEAPPPVRDQPSIEPVPSVLTVTVVSTTGEPVPNARILGFRSQASRTPLMTATCDGLGECQLAGPSRASVLLASADVRTSGLVPVPAQATELRLVLRPAFVLRGTVSYQDGSPAPGALVSLDRKGLTMSSGTVLARTHAEATTSATGDFEVVLDVGGIYGCVAERQGLSSEVTTITTTAASPARLDLVLRSPRTIVGRVLLEETRMPPETGGIVEWERFDSCSNGVLEASGRVRIEPSGDFAITEVAGGCHRLQAEVDGCAPSSPMYLNITGNDQRTVTEPLLCGVATISGHVRLADGSGAGGATVTWSRIDPLRATAANEAKSLLADVSGAFELSPVGRAPLYRVQAAWFSQEIGDVLTATTVASVGDGDIALVLAETELRLDVIEHERGTIVDEGVRLRTYVQAGGGWVPWSESPVYSPNGRGVRIRGLPAGRRHAFVAVTADGDTGVGYGEVPAAQSPPLRGSVVVRPPRAISVTCECAPACDGQVGILLDDLQPAHRRDARLEGGRVVVSDLTLGRHTVRVTCCGDHAFESKVDLATHGSGPAAVVLP